MDRIDRRTFITSAVLGSLATASTVRGIEPFKRKGRQVYKLSLAAYSLRKYLTAEPGAKDALDLVGFLDYCASLGLDGAELTSYYFPKTISVEYLNDLKRQAHVLGLDISGGAIRNDYCQPPGSKLEEDLNSTSQWIDHYAILGVRVIRVFAGNVPKDDSEEDAIKRCIAALERACDAAGKKGIMLALENHGGITSYADTMLKIIKGVQSRWLGVNFDSGNFKKTDDPYAELAKIAPYAINAQIKVDMFRNQTQKEPTDYKRLITLLRDAGYTGWLALEYESAPEPYEAIPVHIAKLREVLGSLGY